MTTTPQQLYQLQELDHRIDGIDAERDRIKRRLAAGVNRPDLTSEAEHHSARAVAVNANATSRREEGERIRERLTGLEARLYSGNTSRRDLSAIQREVDSSKYQLDQLDELLLELEQEQNTHEAAAVAARDGMEAAAIEWHNLIESLSNRLTELESDRETASCQRQDMAVSLPQADLQRYERLRRNKAGTAVALVDNGRVCLACRMALTSNVIRQMRDKSKQVPCSTCGRILLQQ
jgi:predicted  nucleic acid-binding Zn-ribbon protein